MPRKDDTEGLSTALDTLSLSSSSPTSTHSASPNPNTFPLLSLPAELRHKIYAHLIARPTPLDLDPNNILHLRSYLVLRLVNRQLAAETAYVFHAANTFRVLGTHGRFFHTKHPLLTRLAPETLAQLRRLELRLGPGWTEPPRTWRWDREEGVAVAGASACTQKSRATGPDEDCEGEDGAGRGVVVKDQLRNGPFGTLLRALRECKGVFELTVFVECDPEAPTFVGFRRAEGWYTHFCVGLLVRVLDALEQFRPRAETPRAPPLRVGAEDEVSGHSCTGLVRLDGFAGAVTREQSPLLQALEKTCLDRGIRVVWTEEMLVSEGEVRNLGVWTPYEVVRTRRETEQANGVVTSTATDLIVVEA